ncbi:MAG: hypothetical protein NTW52_12490 [Planctomycetota bacterium]|nr:hypothetical protein [Planctomycetota bacterium]
MTIPVDIVDIGNRGRIDTPVPLLVPMANNPWLVPPTSQKVNVPVPAFISPFNVVATVLLLPQF